MGMWRRQSGGGPIEMDGVGSYVGASYVPDRSRKQVLRDQQLLRWVGKILSYVLGKRT